MTDLFIISREDLELFEYLTRHFAGRPDVQIVLDRRAGQRRQRGEPSAPERRQAARRRRSVDADVALLGFAVVVISNHTDRPGR
jgi:hypothetical protein